jgi:2-oxo-3-hexenedioate decarboxylase
VTLAEELIEARERHHHVTAPTKREGGFSLGDGYAVAEEVAKRWQGAGHRVAGIKIGLTNASIWNRLGIDAPVWGPLYREHLTDATVATPDDPVSFPLAPLTAPRIEAEIVVELSTGLGPGADLETIAGSIAWAALGFEFVDCHYPDWALQPPDLVADFCAHAGLVIGPPTALAPAELLALDTFPIELHADGSGVCSGSGDRVAGGPLRAIEAVLAAPHAPTLSAGALIATGALTGGAHPVVAAQHWHIAPGRPLFTPLSVRTV